MTKGILKFGVVLGTLGTAQYPVTLNKAAFFPSPSSLGVLVVLSPNRPWQTVVNCAENTSISLRIRSYWIPGVWGAAWDMSKEETGHRSPGACGLFLKGYPKYQQVCTWLCSNAKRPWWKCVFSNAVINWVCRPGLTGLCFGREEIERWFTWEIQSL